MSYAGRHYVDVALENGHKVIATSRKPESLPKFKAATDDNYLAVALDVTSQESIEKAFKQGLDKFKQIDVVCNNAGFGLSGVFESLSEKQIRMQMGTLFVSESCIILILTMLSVQRSTSSVSSG